MKKYFFIILLFLLFLASYKYNYRELNDLSIVTGIGVSKSNDMYNVSIEIINPKKDGDSTNTPDYVVYKESGLSLIEAFRSIVNEQKSKVYGTHLNILIIDDTIARTDIKEILDFFTRESEIRGEFAVVISNNANDVLENIVSLNQIASKKIYSSLKVNQNSLGNANIITFHDLLSTYLNPYKELCIPSVYIVNEEDDIEALKNIEIDSNTVLGNMVVFKKGKMLGYLSKDESIVYNILSKNTFSTLINTPLSNDKYMVNEINIKDVDINIKEDDVYILIKGNAKLKETNLYDNLEELDTLYNLEHDLNSMIEDLFKSSINSSIVKYNSDIYGFMDIIYKNNKINNYNVDYLKKLRFHIDSNFTIINKGNLKGGIYYEAK